MTASPNLIGIGSGLVAAVLFASLANNSALAVALFYLTPLPVLLAGMGWGLGAALLSMLTASLLLVLVQTLPTAIAFALYIGLPGLTLTYLFLLHRDGSGEARPQETSPSGQTGIEWYPLGRIIAWASVMAGGLVSLGLVFLGGDSETYRHAVRSMFDDDALRQLQTMLGPEFGRVQLDEFIERFTRYVLPVFAAAFWLFVMIGNLWLAAKSAAISGLLERPVAGFTRIEYPPLLVVAFFAAVVLSLASGLIGLFGTAFLGAFAGAFLLLGLAVLHVLLARSRMKPLVLFGLYVGLFVTPWIAPIVIAFGLVEPFLQLRQRVWRQMPPANRTGPGL